ncbi:ABC transporter B family member 26, chloroplastic [Impatiens glandulifera]|uniref:ABC transporter B family member 26, chloroplastic n=1 Tax=Impatiens glandulifera TaxID=253017 RepID=UPI001FB04E43|nr:ABC transporter B family member 26, chloroplastic [Impatiens glandulifera]
MAVCFTHHLQPRLIFSFHHQRFSINNNPKLFHFNLTSNNRYSSLSDSFQCRRFNRFSRPNFASINDFPLQAEIQDDSRRSNVELWEKLRSLISFIREILPGGNWWRFPQQAEVNSTAKPVTVLRALQRMWELISRDQWVIFVAFSALILTAISEISIPHFLTASIFSAQGGEINVFHRNVRLLAVLSITSGICSGVRGCFFSIANMILVKRMREALYSALLSQDISFFDAETVGDLTSRLGADCQQVSRVIGNDLNWILRNVLQGTGALIYLLILSWRLGLCTLGICIIISTIMLIYSRYQKKAAKLTQDLSASANEVAQETLSLIRTVRVYGTDKEESHRYENWLGKLADVSMRQGVSYGLWSSSFNTLYHLTQVIAVLIGGMSIKSGQITAEQLTKFILYSEWLIYSTWWIGDSLSSLMQSVGASEKVFQLMDLSPSRQFLAKGLRLEKLMGHIEFVNVSFKYPSREVVPVLNNVNISVPPNQVVAIVGLSGSGKSTLVNLLLRLYEPTGGQILIDGLPLEDLDITWLRERIGYVGQEPRLFRTDVRSNIKYGCTREITEEDVEWAAKQAYAHEFISALPDGYNTLVDDDLLSGGQKQRIAIARAILRDPNILVLDEATSALDAESEQNVKRVLRALRRDLKTKRTCVVIAHRLSTIQAADNIVVMDGGQVVEMGNHMELLSRDGVYARLIRKQADAVVQ